MRRLVLSTVAAAVVLSLSATMVLGAKPSQGCGASPSGYFVVDRDQWWNITVGGFVAEGITVYESGTTTFTAEFDAFAEAVGFGSGAGLEHFVRVDQWAGMDHNDNGLVCMKRRPITPGNPAYFFNGVDDQASVPRR